MLVNVQDIVVTLVVMLVNVQDILVNVQDILVNLVDKLVNGRTWSYIYRTCS